MKKIFLIAAVCCASGGLAQAATLTTIPGPDDTGGMVMPLVSFNFSTKSIAVNMVQGDTVTMYPLQQYEVWGGYPYASSVFDPSLDWREWYGLLDPTQQHLPFSTQFGFEVISGNANLLPDGSYVYIKATSITDGLKIYDVGYWADVWEQEGGVQDWFQVFGEGNFGSTVGLDNIAAWGDNISIKMWHPVAIVPGPGNYSATFEIYIGDGMGQPLGGWTAADPITLNWVAIPEPGAVSTVLTSVCFLGAVRRFRRGRRVTIS